MDSKYIEIKPYEIGFAMSDKFDIDIFSDLITKYEDENNLHFVCFKIGFGSSIESFIFRRKKEEK